MPNKLKLMITSLLKSDDRERQTAEVLKATSKII
jgi:hypothetical protein